MLTNMEENSIGKKYEVPPLNPKIEGQILKPKRSQTTSLQGDARQEVYL